MPFGVSSNGRSSPTRTVSNLRLLADGLHVTYFIYDIATWDSPPKPNDEGYEDYVRAFDVFLEAQKVALVPLSPAEQRKKDNRPPRDMTVIKDPGFEQGGKLMPFQASTPDMRSVFCILTVEYSLRV